MSATTLGQVDASSFNATNQDEEDGVRATSLKGLEIAYQRIFASKVPAEESRPRTIEVIREPETVVAPIEETDSQVNSFSNPNEDPHEPPPITPKNNFNDATTNPTPITPKNNSPQDPKPTSAAEAVEQIMKQYPALAAAYKAQQDRKKAGIKDPSDKPKHYYSYSSSNDAPHQPKEEPVDPVEKLGSTHFQQSSSYLSFVHFDVEAYYDALRFATLKPKVEPVSHPLIARVKLWVDKRIEGMTPRQKMFATLILMMGIGNLFPQPKENNQEMLHRAIRG